MKTQRFFLAAAVVTYVLGVFSLACSGTYEGSTWKGTITMTYREAGSDKSSSTRNQIDSEKQWNFSNASKVILKVCGNSLEQGYVKSAQVDYSHSWKSSVVYRRSVCQPRGEIKKPGWKGTNEGQLSAIVHPNLVGTPAKASLSVSLQPQGGMRYTIGGGLIDVPIALQTGRSESREYDPCLNSTTTYTLEYKVGAKESPSNCTSGGRTCRSVSPAVPLAFPMTFSHTGTATGNRIAGNKTIPLEQMGEATVSALGAQLEEMARQMPPEIKQQMMDEVRKMDRQATGEKKEASDPDKRKGKTSSAVTVSWDIGRANPCDDVTDQLRQELSMIQAYADPNLVSRARREGWSGQQYDDTVFEYGKSKYASGWWKGGSSGSQSGYSGDPSDGDRRSHIDMALNSKNCSIEGQNEVRKALEQDCVPQVVYDSILEHEKTHAKQCMSDKTAAEFASRIPDSFRKFEQSAYCAGAKKLMNWAEGVCKESDMKPLRETYRTYCPQ